MSKRSRTRAGHSNPTKEKNRRKESHNPRDFTVYQQEVYGKNNIGKDRKRYKELKTRAGLL